eukprot:m.152219 g.152219  ORF g.152219 m.152219 type:complete len:91 (-) comp30795_c7_seq1:263-535(-)
MSDSGPTTGYLVVMMLLLLLSSAKVRGKIDRHTQTTDTNSEREKEETIIVDGVVVKCLEMKKRPHSKQINPQKTKSEERGEGSGSGEEVE